MKKCEITGKTSILGGGYSNKTRATKYNPTGKVRKQINKQRVRVYVPELSKHIKVTTTPHGLKIIKKNGAYKTLKKQGIVK